MHGLSVAARPDRRARFSMRSGVFVTPGGVAQPRRSLIEAVSAWARERGCGRLYWQTQQHNDAAHRAGLPVR